MYLSRIRLRNIRSLRDITIPMLRAGPPYRTVLVGGNSTCKTTILRCIAIGLCNEMHAAALLSELPGSLVGNHTDEGTIEITLQPDDLRRQTSSIITTITKGGAHKTHQEDHISQKRPESDTVNDVSNDDRSNLFVCGYGAGRGTQGAESWIRYRIIDSVYTLFRYDQSLQNPELILSRLKEFNEHIYEPTVDRIRKILRLSPAHTFERTREGIVVSGPKIGNQIPLDAIADGYKATFTWLIDLVGWAMIAGKIDESTGDIRGIVLIDEIEHHIHPSWQTQLLPYLGRIFPRLQVIATTHSPLVALGANPETFVVLKRSRNRVATVESVPDFRRYSAEDMLQDKDLFDAPAYSPETNKKLAEYHKLAAIDKAKRTSKQRQKLQTLARELSSQQIPVLEDTPLAEQLKKLWEGLEL